MEIDFDFAWFDAELNFVIQMQSNCYIYEPQSLLNSMTDHTESKSISKIDKLTDD